MNENNSSIVKLNENVEENKIKRQLVVSKRM